MRYHLIAIGGAVMHNVAIDLKDMGHEVTGSDDEIYDPSLSRLKKHNLLPEKMGWDDDKIVDNIDLIILGKHAKADNPELLKAQSIGLKIMSFPEFITDTSTATQRICIAGSHGKTSTTSMIMHVLSKLEFDFDYLVGANLEGFNKMVKLSGADILVVEGDEYPSSCIDMRAKMLHYKPTISVITGMAWDHVNIYKTYDSYKEAFRSFLKSMDSTAVCFFDQSDEELRKMLITESFAVQRQGYLGLEIDKKGNVAFENEKYPIKIFGHHNMLNLNAALLVCQNLGISSADFFKTIAEFKGAAKRLECILKTDQLIVYKDFAHAPSKCKATVAAMRQKYPHKKIKGLLELHTFSSLSANFIPQYKGTMEGLDQAGIFYDPHAVAMKKMDPIEKNFVQESFSHENLVVFNVASDCHQFLNESLTDGTEVLLIMSSGNLAGFDLEAMIESVPK